MMVLNNPVNATLNPPPEGLFILTVSKIQSKGADRFYQIPRAASGRSSNSEYYKGGGRGGQSGRLGQYWLRIILRGGPY